MNRPIYMAIIEKRMSYKICTPLWDAIQLDIRSIGACRRVAINSIYKTPSICIAITPRVDNKTILKKSVLTFSSVPEKNIAGIKAKM